MTIANKKDVRGSLWRRWDLHFHTPSSFDYRNPHVTNEQIIDSLRHNNISVVAITDHHRIDPDRITALRQLAGDDVTILPGIELRSELGGTTTIHYIGIFPEDADVEELWTQLQGKLGILPARVKAIGDDKIWVSYDTGTKVIRELGGLVSIHAGNRSNSLEKIKSNPSYKARIKTDILHEFVDLLEVSCIEDCDLYRTKVFPSIKFSRPLVAGSDNHNALEYACSCPCWIRGDATFAALKHICCEPDERVFLGDVPPLLQRVARNRTRYIRSVGIRKIEGAVIAEHWFDCHIPFNHGLVAVIGNKGSGKSALADIIGLLGDTRAGHAFSFLTANKFRAANNNKSRFFRGTITWESEGTAERLLSEPVTAELESVKYLPQEYIEQVCNELQEHGSGRFSKELASVIFSHVDTSERLGCESFDDLLKYKTAEKQKAIGVRRDSLRTAIDRIVQEEMLASPAHLQTIREQIQSKQRELAAHDSTKPAAVAKPLEDEAARAKTEQAEIALSELASKAADYRRQADAAKAALTAANKRVAAADRLLTRLTSFEAEVAMFRTESAKDCADLGLSIDDIIKITVDAEKVKGSRTAALEDAQLQAPLLDPDLETGPLQLATKCDTEMAAIRNALAGPSQKYQQYLTDLKLWEASRSTIEGASDVEGTLKYYEQQLAHCTSATQRIPPLFNDLLNKALEVYGDIVALAAVYSELYAPVQRFIEKHPLAQAQFKMSFETKIVENGFLDAFLSKIAQNRRGSFNGATEGRERVSSLLRASDLNSPESIKEFLTAVWAALHFDLRAEQPPVMQVPDQLARNITVRQLYEFIFGLEYLRPFFTLRWAGKDVQQLSPGERGTLLLVFYLLIDRSDIPLIIDQPEENLDNQTVFNVLVPSIKEARSRRQLIIVTHNPNLAVVCDADQIICASIDKEDGHRVTYTAGAIENPRINKHALDILEGTRPAFDNRDSKYHPLPPLV